MDDTFGIAVYSVDVGAGSVSITNDRANSADGILTLSGLDFFPNSAITGIANFTSNVLVGIDSSDVTFTDRSVSINMAGSLWLGGEALSFDLVTRDISAVPLPAGLPLLAAGLAGLALIRRRRGTA